MEFLAQYGMFLAKTATIVIAIAIVLAFVAGMRGRNRQVPGRLQIRKLNQFYDTLQEQLESAVLSKSQVKRLHKERARKAKKEKKNPPERSRVYVIDFEGDIKASATAQLRHEVTAVLSMARPEDEVVVRLESGGGMVHSYGLASSQLARLREGGIPLTVCVDKVAASGGYMMACIGQRIVSAPFALLGSIGVVAQIPNLHRLLKKHDIDYEVLTAGEYKRTLTVFGENTEKGREKFQEDLEITHDLFKEFVARYRPQLDIDRIATGEVWLGMAAQERQLVDELMTSDQYLAERAREADLFQVRYATRKSLHERMGIGTSTALDRFTLTWLSRLREQRFW